MGEAKGKTEERVAKMNKRDETKISLCSRKQRASDRGSRERGGRTGDAWPASRGEKSEGKSDGNENFLYEKKTEARIIRIELNVSIRWWTITYRAREEAGIFRRNTRRWENEKETAMKHNLDIKR